MVDRHVAIEVFLQIVLGLPDLVVGMRTRQRHHRIPGLPAARHAQQQRLGDLQRDLVAAELLHQIETDIDRGINATAAEQPAVLRHELIGAPANLGIALAQYVGHAPVSGRLAAVEQPAFREERNTRANADDIGAAGMPLAQPRQQGWCFCNPVHYVPAGRRQNDDISALDVMDAEFRRQAERAEAGDAAPIDRGGAHAEARLRSLAMKPIPNRARGVKDLDRHDGRRCVTGVQKDDGNIEHAITAFGG